MTLNSQPKVQDDHHQEVHGDPLEINTAYAMDDTSADELAKEEVPLPEGVLVICVIMRSWGWGSEIERQNLQTAASDGPTWVCHSKSQDQWRAVKRFQQCP